MSSLKRNIVFNLIGQTLVVFLGFFSFKYIYSGLGEDALGIIYFSLMLSGLLASALDLGLSKTTTREVAAYCTEDIDYVIKLTQTFSLFYWLAYVIVTILFVILLPLIVRSWINLTTMDSELAYYVLLILGTTSLLAIPRMFLTSTCVGLQRMDIVNYIEVSCSVLQQSGMLLFLLKGKDIVTIAYWIACVSILKVLAYIVFLSKAISFKAMLPVISFEVIRRVKKYTSRMMWVSLLLVVHKQIDKVLISKFLPIGVVGIYSFLYSLISKTALVTNAVSQAIFPTFSELVNKGQRKEALNKFFTLQDVLVFFTLPMFSFLIFFATPIFTFLLNASKAKGLWITLLLMTISFYLSTSIRLVRTYIFAISKPEPAIRSDIISLFIVTPLAIILIYTMGMNGAALSSIMYFSVMSLCIIPRVYKADFNKSAYTWFGSVLSAVIAGCFVYVPAWFFAYTYFSANLLILLSFFVLASLLYGVVAVNIVGSELREAVVSYMPRVNMIIVT